MKRRVALLCLLVLMLTVGVACAQGNRMDDEQLQNVEQLFGSWKLSGSQPPYDRHGSYFPPDHRIRKLAQIGLDMQLYVSGDRVTLVETQHWEGGLLFENGRYALDAAEVEVKDDGIYATFQDLQFRLCADEQGNLCMLPLLTDEEKLALGQRDEPMTGEEAFRFEPLFMDIYGEAPVMKPGTYQLQSQYLSWEGYEKQAKQISALIANVGDITFGENNAVSVAFGDKLYEGTLAYPDAYTCDDKEKFAFFSFEEEGYTFSLSMDDWRNGLVFTVNKGEKSLISFVFSDTGSKLAGIYRANGYPGEQETVTYEQEDENGDTQLVEETITYWVNEETWLTIDENLTLTQTLADQTHVGQLEVLDLMDERRSESVLGVVVLNDKEYTLRYDGDGAVRRVTLSDDQTGSLEYLGLSQELSGFMLAPSTLRFQMGYGIATYNATPSDEETNRLFNTFDDSVLYIGENWDRVVFRQTALQWLPDIETDMLFTQDAMDCEIPVIGMEVKGEGTAEEERILHLDMHGHAMDFVYRANGETKLITGIYHLDLMRQ